MSATLPISISAMPEAFAQLGSIFGRQISIELRLAGLRQATGPAAAALFVDVAWESDRFEFAAEAKTRSTPRVIQDAVHQARRWALETGRLPMVVVPYLAEQRLDFLAEEGVSGLDLCGNGLITVPGRVLLRRSGQPNSYPESRPSRFAYRGATSLVPRVFLRRPEFLAVGRILAEITAAGGSVALSTVSKALTKMADDLIIDRADGRISLVQPDKLLDALAKDFAAPKADRTVQLGTPVSLQEIFRLARQSSASSRTVRTVLSGSSSQDRYAGGLRADVPVIYTNDLDALKISLGDAWKTTDRFANLTVIETPDPTPFFDARTGDGDIMFASPVQTYLELTAGGDKRDQQMAKQVRARILEDLGQ